MKSGIRVLALLSLLTLAGCAGTGTPAAAPSASLAPLNTAAAQEASIPPAEWIRYPGFDAFGLRIQSDLPQVADGAAELVLTANADADLSFTLTDVAQGKRALNALFLFQDDSRWTADIVFPHAGEYQLIIFAKLVSESSTHLRAIARTSVTASVGSTGNWHFFPAYKSYSIVFESDPPRIVGDTVQYTFSAPEHWDLSSSLLDNETGTWQRGASTFSMDGKLHVVTLTFPESGDYTLIVRTKSPRDGRMEWEAIAAATFSATLHVAIPGAPRNWQATTAYRKYGVRVLSSTGEEAGEVAQLEFTSPTELVLQHTLVNRTTGRSAYPGGTVVVDGFQGRHRFAILFPENGDYELTLSLRTNDETGFTKLAVIRFTARITSAPPPEGWKITPFFRRYGMDVKLIPAREIADRLDVTLSIAQPPDKWEAYASISEEGKAGYVATVHAVAGAHELRLAAVFGHSGTYRVKATIKANYGSFIAYEDVAETTVVATVNAGLSPYRLWRVGDTWLRLPLSEVNEVPGQWRPYGKGSELGSSWTAVLGQDVTITGALGPFGFARGSILRFGLHASDATAVTAVSTTLEKDLSAVVSDGTLTLKAGTPVVIGQGRFSCVTTEDTRIVVRGKTLRAPAGSRLFVSGGALKEADLADGASITVAGTAYECAGTADARDWYVVGDGAAFRIITAREHDFAIGSARFTLPETSQITFLGQHVEEVIFPWDTKVTLNGTTETFPPGSGLRLDAQGNYQKLKAR